MGRRPLRGGATAARSLACLIAIGVSGAPAQTARSDQSYACGVADSLEMSLEAIARRVGGDMGVAAIHLESGARVAVNGDRRFPMASVSKIPMAMEFLRRVDAGEVRLDSMVVVRPEDFRAGQSPLAAWSGARPVTVTVDSLFRLMIAVSDNTATDLILGMAGGPEAVTRRLRDLGIEGVDVDRSEARTFADLVGLPDTVPESELYRYSFFRKRDALPEETRQRARLRYAEDVRDSATPTSMAALLQELWRGAGLTAESRTLLLEVMAESRSGSRRIKGLLPRDTPVAHKTGTMASAVNDIGIVTLPDDAGHLAVAAFVNTFRRTTWRRERTIAQATRELYDYFRARPAGEAWAAVGACGARRPSHFTPAGH